MKKIVLFIVILFSQLSQAAWVTSFEEAKKMALATNKLMIVDFWATWCGPCRQMDMDSWSNEQVNTIMNDFVAVKIDIDANKELARMYDVNGIPNVFIMDGNGKVVHSFIGYQSANELQKVLENYALSTEFLANDLANFHKTNNFNTSIRVVQKYLDYSLLVDSKIKSNFLKVTDSYLSDAKKAVSKKDESYIEKNQKLMLIDFFRYAYTLNFDKLNKKLSEVNFADIKENNVSYYYFLKYIVAKGLKSDELVQIEQKTKEIEGFDYFVTKANFILSKYVSN